MSKINESRTEKMRRKSMEELKQIVDSGSLSSAAAEYEILRRSKGGK